MVHRRRDTCRACRGAKLRRFLSLGPTALANSFLRSPQEFASEPSFPLDVHWCEDCSLVQLLDVIDAETLFKSYLYVTGTSDTVADHNRAYAHAVVERLGLTSHDLVVEAASNDGSLLRCFQPYGVRTLGIEPAANIAQTAIQAGVETVNLFFDESAAGAVRESQGPARAVIANNVLAHVDDTLGFLRAARSLLAPGGSVVIEVPYLRELLGRLEYDTIYHEHLCYFSVTSLLRLFEEAGLAIQRVEEVPIHGGSLRIWSALARPGADHDSTVESLCAREGLEGLTSFERYARFAREVEENRQELLALLQTLKDEKRSLAGYGAPAKGNTLLNFCRIGPEFLPYTVDRNPLKVGLYTPGMHIPVMPATTLLERQPDYVLILAWNFTEEIMRQQAEYGRRGGKFIVPIPRPSVI